MVVKGFRWRNAPFTCLDSPRFLLTIAFYACVLCSNCMRKRFDLFVEFLINIILDTSEGCVSCYLVWTVVPLVILSKLVVAT